MKNYYVYEWIRLDTNEPFYVGKGKNDRCFTIRKRNKYFCDILKYCEENSIGIAINILNSNLTDKEALQIECWYIDLYIFQYGYKLTNQTWGGDGGDIVSMMSPEQKILYSSKMRLSCLGKNKGHFHSEESKKKMSESKKGMYKGKNNPMYGKNVKDYMIEEQILQWNKKKSEAMLGKTHLKETKEKISSQVSRKVKGFLNGKELSFDSVLLCKEYFELHYGVSHKFMQKIINSETPYISTREKTKVLHGLVLEKYKG